MVSTSGILAHKLMLGLKGTLLVFVALGATATVHRDFREPAKSIIERLIFGGVVAAELLPCASAVEAWVIKSAL